MAQHTYLVGYLHDKGFGRAFIHLEIPITAEPDLLFCEAQLSAKNGFDCSIFTYQLVEVRQFER